MGRSIAIVLAVWAAVYLPGLGSPEIKGEEGRRILPAVTMLDAGNAARGGRELFRSYVVPMIGSEPYLRKPPLVNWLVAGSFRLFGVRDEWTARLPSALCVLLVALAFVTVAREVLGRGALWAAFAWLLNFGILEKGRLIEIEALYVSLFGLALICWLAFWQERRSPWLTWLIPAIFLGAGLLAKGPVHLLFFYSVVAAVLWRDRQLRALAHPAHFVGLIIMLGIFAAWALPYLEMLRDTRVAGVWSRQFSGRVAGEDFQLNNWLLNIPRAIAYFLPWTALLPFVRVNLLSDQRERALAKGVLWGTAVSFLVVNLLPGDLPRYSMPALVPACWLVGVAVKANAFAWRLRLGRWGMDFSSRLVWRVVGATAVAAAIGFPVASCTVLKHREKVRNIARQIETAIPANAQIYAVNPDYQPFLFYLQRKVIYASSLAQVPLDAEYVLVRAKLEREIEESPRWAPRHATPATRVTDYRKVTVVLLHIVDPG